MQSLAKAKGKIRPRFHYCSGTTDITVYVIVNGNISICCILITQRKIAMIHVMYFFRLVNSQPHSAVWYRIGAVRQLTGSRRISPQLNSRLQEVSTTLFLYKLS